MTPEEIFAAVQNTRYVAKRILRNKPNDVDDVLQEAAFKAWSKIDTFNGQSRLSTWIVRIVINQALMAVRRRLPPSKSIDDHVEGTDDLRFVDLLKDSTLLPDEALEQRRLTEKVREAVSMVRGARRESLEGELAELTLRESAAMRGVTIGAEKARRWHARKVLRERLERMKVRP